MRWLLIVCVAIVSSSTLAQVSGSAAAGKAVFVQNCVLCHGLDGKGDGPASTGLNPKPASFRDPERQRAMTPEKQVRVVTGGGPADKLSPVMPPFGEVLTPKQIRDVVAYINDAFSSPATAAVSKVK